MTEQEIREMIAESGKMKIRDVMAYFKVHAKKTYDVKLVRRNAKEMIDEAKKYWGESF